MLKIQASLDASSVLRQIEEIRSQQEQITQAVLGLARYRPETNEPEYTEYESQSQSEAPQPEPPGEQLEPSASPLAGENPNFAGVVPAGSEETRL
jgi:hypothetical protein